jgi:hypothetical protein
MKHTPSLARRFALRLATHASRVLPAHRADWARAMTSEIEHLSQDSAALRWAAGAVFASYLERARSFGSVKALNITQSFFLSAALVGAGLLVIEGSHLLSQYLLQERVFTLMTESLPTSLLTTDAGSYAPMGILLTVAIFSPLALIAWVLGRALIRWAPTHARTTIKATIAMDAVFLAAAMLVNIFFLMPGADAALTTNPAAIASTAVLWLIRVLFVAAPLLLLLYVHRPRQPATSAA